MLPSQLANAMIVGSDPNQPNAEANTWKMFVKQNCHPVPIGSNPGLLVPTTTGKP